MKRKLAHLVCILMVFMLCLSACHKHTDNDVDGVTVLELTAVEPTRENIPLVEDERYYDLHDKSPEESFRRIVAVQNFYPYAGGSKQELDKELSKYGFKPKFSTSFTYEALTGPASYIKSIRFEACSTGMDRDTIELGTFPYMNIKAQIAEFKDAEAVFDLLCEYMGPTEEFEKKGKNWRVYGTDHLSYVELDEGIYDYTITFEIYISR